MILHYIYTSLYIYKIFMYIYIIWYTYVMNIFCNIYFITYKYTYIYFIAYILYIYSCIYIIWYIFVYISYVEIYICIYIIYTYVYITYVQNICNGNNSTICLRIRWISKKSHLFIFYVFSLPIFGNYELSAKLNDIIILSIWFELVGVHFSLIIRETG